jgi:hypothetical protein
METQVFNNLSGVEGALVGLVVIAFFIVRQFSTRKAVSVWTLIASVALAYLGIQTVGRLDSTAWLLLAVNISLAVALGVARALSLRVCTGPQGDALMRGTSLTLVL